LEQIAPADQSADATSGTLLSTGGPNVRLGLEVRAFARRSVQYETFYSSSPISTGGYRAPVENEWVPLDYARKEEPEGRSTKWVMSLFREHTGNFSIVGQIQSTNGLNVPFWGAAPGFSFQPTTDFVNLPRAGISLVVKSFKPALSQALTKARTLETDGRNAAAIDVIFREIDSRLRRSDFEACDDLLEATDPVELTPRMIVAILSITLAAAPNLRSRSKFFREAWDALPHKGKDSATVLSGLRGPNDVQPL